MAQFMTDSTLPAFVAASQLPVLVDFYKDGCVPCRRVAPLLSKAEEKYAEQLVIVRVNISQNPALVERYGIQAAPTIVAFRGGEEAARHRGVIDMPGLEALIQTIIKTQGV
ncbi:MAG: thioredoxin domain-containing protein [Eubacteriales bacterium]|nr:thioredoxin domain-containing protein [Eubacteriales bacterium]